MQHAANVTAGDERDWARDSLEACLPDRQEPETAYLSGLKSATTHRLGYVNCLSRDAGRLASPALRGLGDGDVTWLPDHEGNSG